MDNYFPVQDVLRTSINTSLEEFVSAFMKAQDYDSVLLMAEVGKKTTAFIDELFDNLNSDNFNIKTVEADVAEEAEVEVSKVTTGTKRKSHFRRISGKPELYGLTREETKDWIFNYLGSRGGKAHIEDVYGDFFKQNYQRFNAYDFDSKAGKPNWKQNITHRIATMRLNDGINTPLVEPVGKGPESKYYVLTKWALSVYNKKASMQTKINFDEDGLALGG